MVSATHQSLEKKIKEDYFREDLYYRLSEITVNIPDLKDRQDDAVLLANKFIEEFSEEFSKSVKELDENAVKAILSYSWPGNVRELENKIKLAVIMSDKRKISVTDLEIDPDHQDDPQLDLKTIREENDKKAIIKALSLSNGNISEMSRLLGISRPTLYGLANQYNINIEK